MTWWWTSDYHFDHSNILKYMKRPYANIEEHNEAMIVNTNAVVKKDDNLIIAGDITLHHREDIVYPQFIDRLNGNKIIMKGNHDYFLGKGKGRYIYHKKIGDVFTATCHYPLRSWNQSGHGSIQMHGHCHGLLWPYPNQIDISVDSVFNMLGEYRPINLEEIMHIIQTRKERSLWKRLVWKCVKRLYFDGGLRNA